MNNEPHFSVLNSDKDLLNASRQSFDVLIVGGGITGAGIALDAVSRGLKVVLIEQSDFASGTSSRSTKLVHGGLRYLEKMQLKFVAQLGHERKILHQNITHNVIPTPVFLPIVKGGQLNKPLTRIALTIYDLLAGVKTEYRTKWVSKKRLVEKYGFIEEKGLKGAFLYNEYKTNDGRLVIETLKKAVEMGAWCFNYTTVESLIFDNGLAVGAKLRCGHSQTGVTLNARSVVNATGPWCESFLNQFDQGMKKTLYPTKGVHIVIPKNRFPLADAFYFDTPDNRMIFAIPRQNFVYVGTTDTPYTGDLSNPKTTTDDANYLLDAVNKNFSGLQLTPTDIVSCWAGIRPLIRNKGKNPGEISRKEELFVSQTGVITITGGKLTGFRLMAKQTVDLIMKKHQKKIRCSTHKIRASGSDWAIPPTIDQLVMLADQKFDEAKQTGITPEAFKVLFYRYGTNIDLVIEKAYELHPQYNTWEQKWIMAELWYAVNYEHVTNLSDFCIYRTEMVLFETDRLKRYLPFMADCLSALLVWDDARKQNEHNKFIEQWEGYQL